MAFRNGFTAMIGVLWLTAPWWASFTDTSGAVLAGVLFGLLQAVSSLLAHGRTGWSSWPNWISLLCGVWFILYPFLYHFDWMLTLLYVVLGYLTVLLNYTNMNTDPPQAK
ncbi:hypothetical protein [Paenibacillus sp.]|uniref:SPW repeat domain-containing protein n=1 Tax=Paenibacillus sp. TaxID=58172 RepID=UPI00356A6A36